MQTSLRQTSVFLISEPVTGADEVSEKNRVASVKAAAEALLANGCGIVMCEDSPDIDWVMGQAESYAGNDGIVYSVQNGAKENKKHEETLQMHAKFGNLNRMGRLNIREIIEKTNVQAVIVIGGSDKAQKMVADFKAGAKAGGEKLNWVSFGSTGGVAAQILEEPGVVVPDRQYSGTLVALAGFRVVEVVKRAQERVDLQHRKEHFKKSQTLKAKIGAP